jgi:hypothetical protein
MATFQLFFQSGRAKDISAPLYYTITIIVIVITTEKEATIQEFIYRDALNVEHEMYDFTSNKWSHWNNNKRFKEKFGSYTMKAFSRLTTKENYTGNITHNKESTAV